MKKFEVASSAIAIACSLLLVAGCGQEANDYADTAEKARNNAMECGAGEGKERAQSGLGVPTQSELDHEASVWTEYYFTQVEHRKGESDLPPYAGECYQLFESSYKRAYKQESKPAF
jgi:hypothetical protein